VDPPGRTVPGVRCQRRLLRGEHESGIEVVAQLIQRLAKNCVTRRQRRTPTEWIVRRSRSPGRVDRLQAANEMGEPARRDHRVGKLIPLEDLALQPPVHAPVERAPRCRQPESKWLGVWQAEAEATDAASRSGPS
jgi:hypothetical protein